MIFVFFSSIFFVTRESDSSFGDMIKGRNKNNERKDVKIYFSMEKKEVFETFVQNKKFFVVVVVDVDVESLSPKNLYVNSFSLKEFL